MQKAQWGHPFELPCQLKLNNTPNDTIKNIKNHQHRDSVKSLTVKLEDLIHRAKGLELHTKPNHKNSGQLDMQKKISKIL